MRKLPGLLPWVLISVLAAPLAWSCQPACSDGVDNDGDGTVDHDGGSLGPGFADPDCADADDPSEAWVASCHDADVTGDGVVDIDDQVLVITSFGPCPVAGAPCPADIDGSGEVDNDDLVTIILFWGQDCNAPPAPDPIAILEPATGSYVEVSNPTLTYQLLPGVSVTGMALDGQPIPIVPSGGSLQLAAEAPFLLRIDVETGTGAASSGTTRFTYSTTTCPYRRFSLSAPATCDGRLMLQAKYTDADLAVYGVSNRAISLHGSWFHAGGNPTPQQFIDESSEAILARLNAILDDPAGGLSDLRTSDDMVLIDIEHPQPLHRYVEYLHDPDPTLLPQMLDALKRRVDAARQVMPNAKLVLWGFQPNPRGRYDDDYDDRLEVFDQAGDLGLFDELDYFMPLLYSHYGPTDFRRVTVGGSTYDVEVFYNVSNQVGEEFLRLFHFHLGPDTVATGGIFSDSALPPDTVWLGGEQYEIEMQGEDFLLIGTSEQATLEVSEEFFLEVTQRYVDQGLAMMDVLRETWPLPLAPLFSLNIFEQNTAHGNDPVPPSMARLLVDTVQAHPATEAIVHWTGKWEPATAAFYEGVAPMSDICGCVVTECTDRVDNDGDSATDRYDPACQAGGLCNVHAPWGALESGFNLPPNTAIVLPVEDPIVVLPGESIDFVGQVTDPEGETWLSPTWTFGFGSDIDDYVGLERTVAYQEEGRYTVRLDATDSFWASDPTRATREVAVCTAPTLEVVIPTGSRGANGDAEIHVADPNPANATTGYNLYRSSSAAGPFTLRQLDGQDADAGTPGVQLLDAGSAGAELLFYRAVPYNGVCELEGP